MSDIGRIGNQVNQNPAMKNKWFSFGFGKKLAQKDTINLSSGIVDTNRKLKKTISKMAKAGLKSIKDGNYTRARQAEEGKACLEKIKSKAPHNSKESILIDASLKTMEDLTPGSGLSVFACEVALNVLSAGIGGTLSAALAVTAKKAIAGEKSGNRRMKISHRYAEAVKEHTSPGTVENEISDIILSFDGRESSKNAVLDTSLDVLSDSKEGSFTEIIAEAGLKAVSVKQSYESYRKQPGDPFVQALADNNPPDTPDGILVRLLDKFNEDDSEIPQVAAREGVLKEISSGSSDPVAVRIARAGLDAVSKKQDYISWKVEAAMPYIQGLKENVTPGSDEAKILDLALTFNDENTSSTHHVLQKAVLKELSRNSKEPLNVRLFRAAGNAISEKQDYISYQSQVGAHIINEVAKNAPQGSAESIFSRLITDFSNDNNNSKTYAAEKAAFRVMEINSNDSNFQKLVKASLIALSEPQRYKSEQNESAKPFLEEARKMVADNSDEAVMLDVALNFMPDNNSTRKTAVYKGVLKTLSSSPGKPLKEKLLLAGKEASKYKHRYNSYTLDSIIPFVEALEKNMPGNSVESELCKIALSNRDNNAAMRAVNKAVIETLMSGSTGTPIKTFAEVGLKALKEPQDYAQYKNQACKPFLEAIREKADEDSKEYVLANAVLNNWDEASNSPLKASNEALLKRILSDDEEPPVLVLAKTGLKAMEYPQEYSSNKSKSAVPFLKEIFDRAGKSDNLKYIEETLAGKNDPEAYKETLNKVIETYEDIVDMLNTLKEMDEKDNKVKGRNEKGIEINGNKVKIGGVELPRFNISG